MALRRAIDNKLLCDYVINIEYITGGDKYNALINMIINNQQWCPLFIYFNATNDAQKFSEDLKLKGIKADYLIPHKERSCIEKSIENYKLQVLCLCGEYNYGLSINNLRTVVFGDLYHNDINRKQVLMIASRKHCAKDFYRIVLPLQEKDIKEGEDIKDIIRTIYKIDPKIIDSIKNRSNQIRINILDSEGDDIDEEKWVLINEYICNNLNQIISEIEWKRIVKPIIPTKKFNDDELK